MKGSMTMTHRVTMAHVAPNSEICFPSPKSVLLEVLHPVQRAFWLIFVPLCFFAVWQKPPKHESPLFVSCFPWPPGKVGWGLKAGVVTHKRHGTFPQRFPLWPFEAWIPPDQKDTDAYFGGLLLEAPRKKVLQMDNPSWKGFRKNSLQEGSVVKNSRAQIDDLYAKHELIEAG